MGYERNAALFDEVGERLNRSQCIESVPDDLNKKGFGCGFRFTNDIALNDSHPDLRVDFLECWEFDMSSKVKHTIFAWEEGRLQLRAVVPSTNSEDSCKRKSQPAKTVGDCWTT